MQFFFINTRDMLLSTKIADVERSCLLTDFKENKCLIKKMNTIQFYVGKKIIPYFFVYVVRFSPSKFILKIEGRVMHVDL